MSKLAYFVGLDYHQHSVQVCVLDSRGRILQNATRGGCLLVTVGEPRIDAATAIQFKDEMRRILGEIETFVNDDTMVVVNKLGLKKCVREDGVCVMGCCLCWE